MLEAIFQALFSYRPVVFQQGEFRFDIGTGSLVAAGSVAVMVVAMVTYRSVRSKVGFGTGSSSPRCAWQRLPSCCSACSVRRSSSGPRSRSRT